MAQNETLTSAEQTQREMKLAQNLLIAATELGTPADAVKKAADALGISQGVYVLQSAQLYEAGHIIYSGGKYQLAADTSPMLTELSDDSAYEATKTFLAETKHTLEEMDTRLGALAQVVITHTFEQ